MQSRNYSTLVNILPSSLRNATYSIGPVWHIGMFLKTHVSKQQHY